MRSKFGVKIRPLGAPSWINWYASIAELEKAIKDIDVAYTVYLCTPKEDQTWKRGIK
ncbi:hypothetical protein [Proteus phage 2]|nr:hypothetical protein [Proteus phage 1]QNN97905.1 hypothetical protein [Proteus phage 2]QOC55012.1 hypothetical protein [Proteus phage M4H10_20]